jgi:hypothetical protein
MTTLATATAAPQASGRGTSCGTPRQRSTPRTTAAQSCPHLCVIPYHTNHIDGMLFTCLVKFFLTKILEGNVSATPLLWVQHFYVIFTWHVKIIWVNDFDGTSKILLVHLKFCWRGFCGKNHASKRPASAKFSGVCQKIHTITPTIQ